MVLKLIGAPWACIVADHYSTENRSHFFVLGRVDCALVVEVLDFGVPLFRTRDSSLQHETPDCIALDRSSSLL
jgi:hypothetical protein